MTTAIIRIEPLAAVAVIPYPDALVVRNGWIVDPSQGIDGIGDLLIEGGRIKGITVRGTEREEGRPAKTQRKQAGEEKDTRVIDAQGLHVFPGLVDLHTHLREPGFEYKETIKTGTEAAIRGGFTTLCSMTHTFPINDNASVTEFIIRKSLEGSCTVLPIGAITKGQKGEELVEVGTMKDEGCVAFSDDGRPVMNSLIMRRALEYSKAFGLPMIL